MADETALGLAVQRLEQAVLALENTADDLDEADRRRFVREREHALMASDRTRLAEDLDAMNARMERQEQTNRAIADRVDIAIEKLRGLLAEHRD